MPKDLPPEGFEWSPEKQQQNIEKHGVDFFEASFVYSDPFNIGWPRETYEGQPMLTELLQDEDKKVRAAASEALKSIQDN